MLNKDLPNKVMLLGETNLLLDVAFAQDTNCEYLVELAVEQKIHVAIPEYALAEAEDGADIVRRFVAQVSNLGLCI